MTFIPTEISKYFSEDNFRNYPLIEIPQSFQDSRCGIINVADGILGDVSVINSEKMALRANHIHQLDWHLCYLIEGEIRYYWKESLDSASQEQIKVTPGKLIYTPPKTPHMMLFMEKSIFVTVSGLSRMTDSYELDTKRLDSNYFDS